MAWHGAGALCAAGLLATLPAAAETPQARVADPAGTFAFRPVAGDRRVEVRDLSAADEIPSTPSTGAPK